MVICHATFPKLANIHCFRTCHIDAGEEHAHHDKQAATPGAQRAQGGHKDAHQGNADVPAHYITCIVKSQRSTPEQC